MRRHLAVLATVAVLAAGEILALPASAEMPMSPVYPTTSRPKRVPPAAQPMAAAVPSAAEKPPAPGSPNSAKEAAITPAKDAAAGPVFEAAIPPPAAVPDNNTPQSEAAAEAPSPPARKTAAKPRKWRPAPRYAYSPYSGYRIAPAGPVGYADPQRGWGGGRYGPTPMSDGQ